MLTFHSAQAPHIATEGEKKSRSKKSDQYTDFGKQYSKEAFLSLIEAFPTVQRCKMLASIGFSHPTVGLAAIEAQVAFRMFVHNEQVAASRAVFHMPYILPNLHNTEMYDSWRQIQETWLEHVCFCNLCCVLFTVIFTLFVSVR